LLTHWSGIRAHKACYAHWAFIVRADAGKDADFSVGYFEDSGSVLYDFRPG